MYRENSAKFVKREINRNRKIRKRASVKKNPKSDGRQTGECVRKKNDKKINYRPS